MLTCPFCKNTLTDTDIESGKCPACKRALPADKTSVGGSLMPDASLEQPPSEDDMGATDRRDEAKTISPDASPERPPSEDDLGATDRRDQAKTISPDASPERPPSEDDMGANDRSDQAKTIIPDSSPERPPSEADIGATDRGDDAKTVPPDASSERPPSEDILGTTDYPNDARTLPPGDSAERPPSEDDADARSTLASAGGIRPATDLRNTIKEDLHAVVSESSLVIQPRVVRESHHHEADQADYVVIDEIGRGGMGVVYAARQSSIKRVVAVKKLLHTTGKPQDIKKRRSTFLSEAIVTGDLEHPNVVPIYDLGVSEDGELFYSMKQVKGTPWDRVISKKTEEENVEILMKIADAVAFSHSRNVVHRDLKPENVMLGDFNEVLLMDWGLAMQASPSSGFSIAGSPAYMAPEMADGKLKRIGPHSDIYLLGAMLFEIITGKPPHTGNNKTACVTAAAKNEIVATEKKGELLDIARKALATDPQDRYARVEDLQNAITEYRSHLQSVVLSATAAENLATAKQNRDYKSYAQAMFGFAEAVELWEANHRAREGVKDATLSYADTALHNGDYDLGASLLDAKDPTHAELYKRIKSAERERNTRQQRLKTVKRLAASLAAVLLIGAIGASILYNAKANEATAAEEKAVAAEGTAINEANLAREAEGEAKRQAIAAEEAKAEAVAAQGEATRQATAANEAKAEAVEAQGVATEQAEIAGKARDAAVESEQLALAAQKEEAYSGYISKIGFASATVDQNAFNKARVLLDACPKEPDEAGRYFQDAWEWRRLQYLCNQAERVFRSDVESHPLEAVALSPNGKLIAAGGWSGKVQLWDAESGAELDPIDTGGQYVFALAFSPDERYLAVGTDDAPNYIKIWDLQSEQTRRQPHKVVKGHGDAVLSVVYSGDGKRLLTSSYDKTARLWNLETPQPTLVQTFEGYHGGTVWSAAFSPDESRIVTASQDGTAIVWTKATGRPERPLEPFDGHKGPVYCASFSPDGKLVASGGYDGRALIWNPQGIEPKSENLLGDFISDRKAKEANATAENKPNTPSRMSSMLKRESSVVRALDGHTGSVRSVRFSADGERVLSGSNDNTVKVWKLANGELQGTFRGHGGPVRSCVFVANQQGAGEQAVLSGSLDHSIRLWKLAGHNQTSVFGGRILTSEIGSAMSPVLGAAFSSDGMQIVAAGQDQKARTFDSVGKLTNTFSEGHDDGLTTGIFLPDGRRLLTAAKDNTLRLWSVDDGAEIWEREGTGANAVAALSHDGQWVLTSSDDKMEIRSHDGKFFLARNQDETEIKWNAEAAEQLGQYPQRPSAILWNSKDGKPIGALPRPLQQSSAIVAAAAISDNDEFLLTGDTHGTWVLWDAKTLKMIRRLTETGIGREITAIFFLPDGKSFLTADSGSKVALWDLESGEMRETFKHSKSIRAAVLSPADGSRILTLCEGKSEATEEDGPASRQPISSIVTLWNVETAEEILELDTGETGIQSVAFSADGQRALTACADRTIRLWDLRTGKEIRTDGRPFTTAREEDHRSLSAAVFAPDGGVLALGGNFARLYTPDGEKGMGFSPHAPVTTTGFSPDGKQIVTGSLDTTARIWDVDSGKALLRLEGGHTGDERTIRSAVFSPDGAKILTAADDSVAVLWDAVSGQVIRKFEGHADRVRSAVFSSDGKLVLTASDDKTACVWDIATGERRPLVGHDEAVLYAAFSPDDKQIITASEDNSAKIWNAETCEQIHTLAGHAGIVTSAGFSPNGLRAITGSEDKTAKIWELQRGEEILTLRGHSSGVTSAAFSPHEQQRDVLTASRDGTLILWQAIGLDEAEGFKATVVKTDLAQTAQAR